MFESFDVDFFGLFVVFGLACQLCFEVLVFGWQRNMRRLNKEIWADFFKTHQSSRRIIYGFLCAIACIWVFGLFVATLEVVAAALVCGVFMGVSLYFTYAGSNTTHHNSEH